MKRIQQPCRCPAFPFPHRKGSGSKKRNAECAPWTRDYAGQQNEADGRRRRLIYLGLVNEL